jgi:hypothetical protein
LEIEETTEDPGDSGGGYGHSRGGRYRGQGARAPPGASERGAVETAETAGDLGDGGGGGDQDGGGSGTTGYVMEDGQDGIEQQAARRAARASATLSAQRTRAAEELHVGSGGSSGSRVWLRDDGRIQIGGRARERRSSGGGNSGSSSGGGGGGSGSRSGSRSESISRGSSSSSGGGGRQEEEEKKKVGKQSRMGRGTKERYRKTRDARR